MQKGICHECENCEEQHCPGKNFDAYLDNCPVDISDLSYGCCPIPAGNEYYVSKNYTIISVIGFATKRVRKLLYCCLLCRNVMTTCTGFTKEQWDKIEKSDDKKSFCLSCFEH